MDQRMKIRLQTEEEVIKIYTERMELDFPPAELKPLETLLKLSREGSYLCYGAYDESKCLAYAYFMKHPKENVILLDYFAVEKAVRGQGYGSCALERFLKQMEPGITVLIEAEQPDTAEDAQQLKIRRRRIAFYEKNHMLLSEIVTEAFGVEYVILLNQPCEKEKVTRCYMDIYQSMIPKEHYSKVRILSMEM